MVKINWVIFRVPGCCFLMEEFCGLQLCRKITSLSICTESEALHVLSEITSNPFPWYHECSAIFSPLKAMTEAVS